MATQKSVKNNIYKGYSQKINIWVSKYYPFCPHAVGKKREKIKQKKNSLQPTTNYAPKSQVVKFKRLDFGIINKAVFLRTLLKGFPLVNT